MKKVIAFALALVMAFALVACTGGGTKADDPNVGVYKATSVEMMGFEMSIEDVFEGGFTIELKGNGKCQIMVDGEKASGKYTIDGDQISVKGGGLELEGTINAGTMLLEDDGMTFTLVNSDYKAPAASSDSGASFSTDGSKASTSKSADDKGSETQQAAVPSNEFWITGYTVAGFTYEGSDLIDMGMDQTYLKLNDDGTAVLALSGDEMEMQWEDGYLTMAGMKLYPFVYVDADTIELTMYDTITYTLKRGTGASAAPSVPAAQTLADYDVSWWEGTWYGWVAVTDGTDAYANHIDKGWDHVAELSFDGSTGTLTLWDLNDTEHTQAIDVMDVQLEKGLSAVGKLVYVGDELGFNYDYWESDPAASAIVVYDHMIEISVTFRDADGGWYSASYFLRPWGMSWEDVRADAGNTDMLYPDMMPFDYDTWYVYQVDTTAAPATDTPAAQPDAPAATVTENKGDGSPYGSSDGVISYDKLCGLYRWLDEMNWDFAKTLTFDDISNAVGKLGKDKQDNDGSYAAAEWSDGSQYYVVITFYNRNGKWGLGSFTTGIPSSEYSKADISGFPKVGVAAAGDNPTAEISLTAQAGFSGPKVTVTAQVPTVNWYAIERSRKVRFANTPNESDAAYCYNYLEVEAFESEEKVNFYQDKFENYADVAGRTIGGISMVGRTYKYIGMEWTEYYGQLNGELWISVKITDVDFSAGTEADAIINSLTFTPQA